MLQRPIKACFRDIWQLVQSLLVDGSPSWFWTHWPITNENIIIVDFHVCVKSSHASKTSLSVQSYSQSSHDSCVSHKLLFKRPKNNSYDLTNLGKLPSRLVLSIDNLITFQQLDKVGAQSPFQPLLLSAFISDYRWSRWLTSYQGSELSKLIAVLFLLIMI